MSNAQNINGYRFSATDRLFFDANIWLLIYGPQGSSNDRRSQTYSGALAGALHAKSQILIDVLVISEFINRIARIEYDIQLPDKSNRPDFKPFRNSPAFVPIAQSIAHTMRQILKYTVRIESGFSGVDIQALLTEFETGGSDYNDQMLVSICKTQNLMFVTHDADFKNQAIDILTANSRILIP